MVREQTVRAQWRHHWRGGQWWWRRSVRATCRRTSTGPHLRATRVPWHVDRRAWPRSPAYVHGTYISERARPLCAYGGIASETERRGEAPPAPRESEKVRRRDESDRESCKMNGFAPPARRTRGTQIAVDSRQTRSNAHIERTVRHAHLQLRRSDEQHRLLQHATGLPVSRCAGRALGSDVEQTHFTGSFGPARTRP